MIVKNEEDTLERCLESIKDTVDEIIIVDTGSSDKTKEIALNYTDKVYDFEEIRAKIEAQDPVTQILFFITIIIVAAKAAVELVLTVIRIIVWILGRFLA